MSLATAAAAAGVLLVSPPADTADAEFERLVAAYARSGSWTSPTASLLEIPGIDLAEVPSIGGALPGVDGSDAPNGRDS